MWNKTYFIQHKTQQEIPLIISKPMKTFSYSVLANFFVLWNEFQLLVKIYFTGNARNGPRQVSHFNWRFVIEYE